MVREPDATMQLAPQNIQLMSKHRVLSFKPCLRLEWRGQDGHNETEEPNHSASLGDSITSSTRIRFSVHTAIQQVGIGDNFSQSAFTQNHHELVTVIDRALASTEFTQLNQDQKDAFSDTAMVVKEEASKSTPDVGKLKRWGTRLVDLSKDIGMKVAAGEIVHLLNSMFGG
jgi:hypothetical protein